MTAGAQRQAPEKELLEDLLAVEAHARGLIEANRRLAARGLADARFSAILGGTEYLQMWRTWIKRNLGANW